MRPLFFTALVFAAFVFVACPSAPNPVCDAATHVDLASKVTTSCSDVMVSAPLNQCELKIHGCSTDDQTTLRAWLSCLSNLPVCTNKTDWLNAKKACDETLPGLSDTCKAQFFPDGTGGGAGGGSGGGAGGGGMIPDAGRETLPCDVAGVVGTYCGKCHSFPPTYAAPYPLVKRSDFTRPYPADMTVTMGQRCALRVQQTDTPMPPDPEPKPSDAEKMVLINWVAAGMPDGTCTPDAGEIDAGPAPTTCSGTQMSGPSTVASSNMDPGYACQACHNGQNFQGQNPFGNASPGRAYFFMGTVFPDFHEHDLCIDTWPPTSVVYIYDAHGTMQYSLTPNTVGNFYYPSRLAGLDLPYTAQVVGPTGKSRWMLTPQAIGDCNSCHTEQGLNGAPGRIVVPQ